MLGPKDKEYPHKIHIKLTVAIVTKLRDRVFSTFFFLTIPP